MKRALLASMLVAMACMPSVAWAVNTPELTYSEGMLAKEGSSMRGVGVGESKLTSASNTIACSSSKITGTLTKNSETKVEADINTSTFNGGGACSGGFSISTAPSEHGLPWCLRSTPEMAEDEFQVRGAGCSTTASQPIRFVTKRTTTIWNECIYERSAAIVGTYKTYPEDALLTSNGVVYSKVSGSLLCPVTTSLDTSITLEKDGVGPMYMSAGPLATFPAGTPLAVGSKISGRNVGNISMTAGELTQTCTGASLTGTLRKNNGTEVEADIETAAFTGTGTGGTCTSPFGDTTWTFQTASNGLPWCLRATSKFAADEFQIRGNSCASTSRPIRIVAERPTTVTDECTYERAAALSGTFTTHPEDATLKFTNSTFLEAEPKSSSCPDETTLDTTLTLETEETGTHPMYID